MPTQAVDVDDIDGVDESVSAEKQLRYWREPVAVT